MARLAKVMKGFQSLSDEEKKEFEEFFKTEVSEDDEPEEVVEEEKEEEEQPEEKVEKPKVEEKPEEETQEEEPKVELDFEKMFNELNKKFDAVVEKVGEIDKKTTTKAGVKAKPKEPSDDFSFETIYAQTVSKNKQNSV